MRSETITAHTNCNTEARAHRTYHSFLHILQKAFNKQPNKMHHAVELTEALQVHVKKCV